MTRGWNSKEGMGGGVDGIWRTKVWDREGWKEEGTGDCAIHINDRGSTMVMTRNRREEKEKTQREEVDGWRRE